MEFWGVEVKPGKPLKVAPEEDNLIHISQATLDCKGKMTESVLVTVTVDGTKLVIGTLSQEKFPQISFDLVFEKEFELSHNCTKGSVHFIGYRSPNIQDESDDYSGSEDEEEELAVPAPIAANGTGAAVSNVVKAEPKPKAKPEEVKPEEDESDEDSDEEDDSDDSDEGMDVDSDDSDDSEESEKEEETPQKPEPSNKKRAPDSASKTPISAKKAKPAWSCYLLGLQELEDADESFKTEQEDAQASLDARQPKSSAESVIQPDGNEKDGADTEAIKSVMLEKLESKKNDLSSMEEKVQGLERKWAVIQERALKQPSPAQREKTLDKQLHSLIEQLAAKQAQAEGIVGEIHSNEMELERLNSLWRRYESFNVEGNAARNRFKRTNSDRGFGSDHEVDAQSYLPYSSATRNETQTRLMYLRSAFVVYILALHVLVFIKISF